MANVLFSGGRGNKSLLQAISKEKDVSSQWQVIVNGLDDGASTGAIRELLGNNSHGISDFLKVASAMSPNAELQSILEERLPVVSSFKDELELSKTIYDFISGNSNLPCLEHYENSKKINDEIRSFLSTLLEHLHRMHKSIPNLSDFKIGNIIFASMLVKNKLNFQEALENFMDFCSINKEKFKIIQSTEDNSYLVGLLKSGSLLPNEAAVVLTRTSDTIENTYQLTEPLTSSMIRNICSLEMEGKMEYLSLIETVPAASIPTLKAISSANAIIYGAGTPFSSLLPSLELKNIANEIKQANCPKILVINLAKETSNTLSAKDVIEGIFRYLKKSNGDSLLSSEYLSHVIMPINTDESKGEGRLISMNKPEIIESFDWLEIIEDDITSSDDDSKHDGAKLMNCINSIIKNA
jgi:2-phospho-L-lactate transferase/gluconeogenesis factor (CofD/UPF0052 family)